MREGQQLELSLSESSSGDTLDNQTETRTLISPDGNSSKFVASFPAMPILHGSALCHISSQASADSTDKPWNSRLIRIVVRFKKSLAECSLALRPIVTRIECNYVHVPTRLTQNNQQDRDLSTALFNRLTRKCKLNRSLVGVVLINYPDHFRR